MPSPRVAFFPDSFHEVNGVAHTARQFTAWAGRVGVPFLCVRAGCAAGPQMHRSGVSQSEQGSVQVLELPRGFASFPLDKDLRYDPLFVRHGPAILRALRAFRPDIVHVTGPSELGMLGAACAHHLGIPLAASWHTNVHEYAARRAAWLTCSLPRRAQPRAAGAIEQAAFRAAARFYRTAQLLFAPNPELCDLLARATGRPCLPMTRGIDAQLFSPEHRTAPAPAASGLWTLGYVGRLSVEKNVALLPHIAAQLAAAGTPVVRFLIIGQGAQEQALRKALPGAQFPGVLRGAALARAYANMDCFLFPSHTDTFGNVVLEALASGVPAIVTPSGGPAHIVKASAGGGIIAADGDFAAAVASLFADPQLHAVMRIRARAYAAAASWDRVFAGVYQAYRQVLP